MSDNSAAQLTGRAMLVTGASSGIGRAIAIGAAKAGADVAITYRTNERGARDVEREIRAMGRKAATFRADVADETSVRELGPAARFSVNFDVYNVTNNNWIIGYTSTFGPNFERPTQVLAPRLFKVGGSFDF